MEEDGVKPTAHHQKHLDAVHLHLNVKKTKLRGLRNRTPHRKD
jgi:hypothetical protein